MKIIKAQSLTRFSTMTHSLLASLSLQRAILVDFCYSCYICCFSYTFLTAVFFKTFFSQMNCEKN